MAITSKQRQIKEIVRCGKDPVYFMNRYLKIQHPTKGLIDFNTYPFQDDCVKDFNDHRFNIILKSRQLGISTLTAAYAVWLAIFYKDKNVLVIATKLAVAQNFIKKVKVAIRSMPKWLLMPEIVGNNKQAVEFSNGNQVNSDSNAFGVAYDANAQKVVIVYADDDDSDNGKVVFATVSGTAVTVTTPIFLDGSSGTPVRQFASVYDATGKRVIVSYTLNSNDSTYNNAVEPGATNLTTANFVGVADSAISASAAGSVIVQGGTVSGITDPFGTVSLTLGSADTTSGNNQKENVSMAYDSNADRTILVYRDGADSDKLKCIIGTLSGTSTSWGTAVEIVGATAGNRGTAVVYDSNAQRVLIAYTKADTYVYVRVGEISGTSVTLGTEVAASSSNSYYPELSYDVADQKVLLVQISKSPNYKVENYKYLLSHFHVDS